MNTFVSDIEFDLNGKKLRGLTCGDENAPILLCLHGWLDNSASFTHMLPALAKAYRVVAIDWFGHGHSDHRSLDAHYHFVDWAYDLLQLIDINNWQSVHIVGHSMGAMVASAFTAAFPDKVLSLTMIDAFGFLSLDESETTTQLKKGLQSRLTTDRKSRLANNKPIKSSYGSIAEAVKARAAVADFDESVASLLVERGIKGNAHGFVWRADPRVRHVSPYRWSLLQAQQVMKDITVPTQLIHGDNGMDMVKKGLLAFKLGTTEFNEFTLHGGHHVHMELPEETAQLVLTFLTQYAK